MNILRQNFGLILKQGQVIPKHLNKKEETLII